MSWQDRSTAPRTGERFIAWDAHRGCCLFSVHWDGDDFITDYEAWSGNFYHWMPIPKRPSEDL